MTIKRERLHYSWVMVLLAHVVLATQALVSFSFGIFLKPLAADFNWDRGALSSAVLINMLLMGILGIYAGRLSDRYGPRTLVTISGLLVGVGLLLMSQINTLWQVYLIWGLIIGIGGGCRIVPIMSTVPRWFAKRTGIAVAICSAGFGVGAILAPLLTQWLVSTYDWRHAFVILGLIIFIVVVPLAQFMKHSPQRIGLKPYGEDRIVEEKQTLALPTEGISFHQAIRTRRFWIYGLIQFCFFFCCFVIFVHIVPYINDIGFSEVAAAGTLSIVAGMSLIGRLSMGFISDRMGSRLALSACLFLGALALLWLLFAQELWMFYVFAVVFGYAFGSVAPLETIVPIELFGLSSLGVILATLMLFTMSGAGLGAMVAGSIFDATGSYSLAFLICVVLGMLALILSLTLLKAKSWRSSSQIAS